MLKNFNKEIKRIISEANVNKYVFPDELLEDAYDKLGFTDFSELLNNKEFVEKLKNTDKKVLEDAKNSLWEDNIEKYDDDSNESKEQALKFYNYLKELILEKD